MKNIFYLGLLFLIITSCDRTFENEIITVTTPELHVFVWDTEGNAVEGANVTLFKSNDDLNNDENQVASGATDNEGKIIFTEENLKEPGKFFVKVINNDLTVTKETPYLLLNDGHTYLNITLQ